VDCEGIEGTQGLRHQSRERETRDDEKREAGEEREEVVAHLGAALSY
jgi:hypothetical protein